MMLARGPVNIGKSPEAGVSLTEALEAFSNQSQSMRISSEIDSVRQEVSEGDQLSSAFARRDRTLGQLQLSRRSA